MRRLAIPVCCFLLASCAAPEPVPLPPQKPKPVEQPATPAAPPVAQRPMGEWIDWPLSAGSWVYRTDNRGSIALFGAPGADALVTMRCDRARARIYLSIAGSGQGGSFVVRTSSTLKSFTPAQTGGTPPYVAAEMLPSDTILDAMAFSRGRFALEVGGVASVAIPAWAEIGRVIEDCRA